MKKLFILVCTALLTLTMSVSVLADVPDLPDEWWEQALNPEGSQEETKPDDPDSGEKPAPESPDPEGEAAPVQVPQGRTPESGGGSLTKTGCGRRSAVLIALSCGVIGIAAGALGYVLGMRYGKNSR